jgi:integral membrane protein (TIGR01906 family)
MYDVKTVIRSAMNVLLVSIVFEIGWGYWSSRSGKATDFRKAIARGGWLSVGLVITILVYLAMNFNSLFTNFHRIFFEGDTWLFRYSDTLIRLFPIQFWRDAFIWIAVLTLLVGGSIGYFVPEKTK